MSRTFFDFFWGNFSEWNRSPELYTIFTDSLKNTTKKTYTANTIQETHCNGRTDTTSFDKGGRVSKTALSDRETQKIGDALRAVEKTLLPGGKALYDFYNREGYLMASVDAENQVTLYQYDDNGRPAGSTALATAQKNIDLESMDFLSLFKNLVFNAKKDRKTTVIYDKNNRLIYKIDGENFVTEYRYTFYSQKPTAEIRYATALSEDRQFPVKADPTNDRIIYRKYDVKGREIACLESIDEKMGVLTTTTYGFNLIEQRRYATAVVLSEDFVIPAAAVIPAVAVIPAQAGIQGGGQETGSSAFAEDDGVVAEDDGATGFW